MTADLMRNIPLTESRCRGYDPVHGTQCKTRDTCARHVQLARDRDLQLPPGLVLPGGRQVRVMTIGFVVGNDCTYRREEQRHG